MKQLIIATLLAALFGAPAFAQDSTTTATGADPAGAVAEAEDPSVEIVFWDSVKDSDNPDLFLAYLKRYPDGVFAVIAEERLKEIYGGDSGANDTMENDTGEVMMDDGDAASSGNNTVGTTTVVRPNNNPNNKRAIVRQIQRNLKRLGCYKGPIDGIWGNMSRNAARAFNNRTSGPNISARTPGQRAVTILRGVNQRVCW